MYEGKKQRLRFTAAESAEIWDRWQRDQGLKSIGRVFGKTSSSIFAHLRPTAAFGRCRAGVLGLRCVETHGHLRHVVANRIEAK